MRYDEFIATVEEAADVPTLAAERAVLATLTTLSERISAGEAHDVAEQLPDPLRPVLDRDARPEPFDVGEFLRRVATREGVVPPTAERHARAVFLALGRAVGPDEIADMASELSKDFDALLAVAHAPSDVRASDAERSAGEPLSTEEFVARVARRTGLDKISARRATEAVLEVLAIRISGGEADDLAAQLPRDLRPPIERGKAQSGEPARPLSVEEFVLAVAWREGVSPEHALTHARAVFATLREALSDKELSDLAAQLPKQYAMLLAPT